MLVRAKSWMEEMSPRLKKEKVIHIFWVVKTKANVLQLNFAANYVDEILFISVDN